MTNAFGTASWWDQRPTKGYYILGTAGLGLSLAHLITEGGEFGTILEAIIIATLSGVIVYSGYDLTTRDLSDSGSLHAFHMTCLSALAFALLAVAISSIRFVQYRTFPDLQFMIILAGVLGGAFGGRANLYAVQSREELTHNQELTKLLNVNQRVLRHNLRNELAIVLGHLENLEAKVGPESPDVQKVRAHLDELLDLSDNSRQIVSIWEDDTLVEFSLQELVDECTQRFSRNHPEASISTDIAENHTIRGHSALSQAINEALENAIIHNDEGVEIMIECSESVRDGHVLVSIVDTGSGLPHDERHALFQPTETPLSHGEGLGLWVIYWTIKRSGGKLTFRENDPSGAVVDLQLPAA